MKGFFTKLILTVAALAFTTNAYADLLLEPYLGFHTGNWKQSTTEKDLSGPSFGARVGYQTMGFMVGADYMTGLWKDKSNPANDVTPADLGLFVGYNFPIMLRAYLTYTPSALTHSLKFKNSSGSSTYEEGSTMKLGVGFTALPLVSINLEYIMGKYSEVNGVNLTTDRETTLYGLTVSAPLTF